MSRRTDSGNFRHVTASTLVIFTLIALLPMMAWAGDSDESFQKAPHVSFDSLWIQSRSGRLVVNYDISDEDWKRLQKADVAVWVTVYFPSEFAPPALEPTYSVELDERSGEARFPRWLRAPEGETVSMCISGAGPGDNLGLRKGYMCDALVEREMRSSKPGAGKAEATVEMTYRPGIQRYPMPGTQPDFNPPMPQGMPQLPAPTQ